MLAAPECTARLIEEIAIVQPKIVVVMGTEALDILNDLQLPLAREVVESPGLIQRLTPSIEALYVPDIDRSLDEESAKRAFWSAFRELGTWWSEFPPYEPRCARAHRNGRPGLSPDPPCAGRECLRRQRVHRRQLGDDVIEPHDEQGAGSGKHEELYVVMTGHAEFELDGEVIDAPTGTLVFARPEQHRGAKALAADTTIVVIGGKPDTAGPPSPFEYWYLATPAYRAGDYERAYESLPRVSRRTRRTRRCTTTWPVMRRWRDGARALRHLEVAFAGNPKAREWAAGDSDLASLDI